jgi:hypothetical protein
MNSLSGHSSLALAKALKAFNIFTQKGVGAENETLKIIAILDNYSEARGWVLKFSFETFNGI